MFLVFDMGGTNLRAARVDPATGALDCVVSQSTPNFFGDDNVGDALGTLAGLLAEVADRIAGGAPITAICVGFPGPVDDDGCVLAAPTVWGRQALDRFPLKALLEARWPGVAVEIVNDITAAGYNFVDARNRDFVIATVGSGVGSKLFMEGKPVLGANFRGGEIGHLRVDFSADAPVCDCGGVGHLGAIASGRGVLRSATAKAVADPPAFRGSALFDKCGGDPGRLANDMLVDAFRRGDAWMTQTLRDCSRPLAQAFASVHLHAGIERFIVIGGFAQALGEDYRRLLCDGAQAIAWNNGFSWERGIHLAGASDMPGLGGAARILLDKYASARPDPTVARLGA